MHLRNFIMVCICISNTIFSEEILKLRLFLFSLTGEATTWLDDMLAQSITTWEELVCKFIDKFFPPVRTL